MNNKTDIINRILKTAYLASSFLLLICGLIWIYFIVQGWIHIGHLPKYGDPEIISFDGFDRILIIYSSTFMFYGFCIWAGTILLNKILKTNLIKKRKLMAGAIIVLLNILIVLSPSFTWALD